MEATVYKGINSPFVIGLRTVDGRPFGSTQTTAVTQFKLRYNGSYIDSASCASCFNATSSLNARGEVVCDIGTLNPTTGIDTQAEFIIYEATATSGRVAEKISLTVSSEIYGSGTTAGSV